GQHVAPAGPLFPVGDADGRAAALDAGDRHTIAGSVPGYKEHPQHHRLREVDGGHRSIWRVLLPEGFPFLRRADDELACLLDPALLALTDGREGHRRQRISGKSYRQQAYGRDHARRLYPARWSAASVQPRGV